MTVLSVAIFRFVVLDKIGLDENKRRDNMAKCNLLCFISKKIRAFSLRPVWFSPPLCPQPFTDHKHRIMEWIVVWRSPPAPLWRRRRAGRHKESFANVQRRLQ